MWGLLDGNHAQTGRFLDVWHVRPFGVSLAPCTGDRRLRGRRWLLTSVNVAVAVAVTS
jgi:hypothetical protein